MKKIFLLNSSISNAQSLIFLLEKFDFPVLSTDDLRSAKRSDILVVPGVCSFGAGMAALRRNGNDQVIIEHAQRGGALLGICFGAQALLESSDEAPGVAGLSLVPGLVKKLPSNGARLPNIGWRTISGWRDETRNESDTTFANKKAYFSHTYYLDVPESIITTKTRIFDFEYCASFEKNNIIGIQFHPEMSGAVGAMFIKSTLYRKL